MKYIFKYLAVLFVASITQIYVKAQSPNILEISYHNPNVAVEHMVEVNGSLFSILPIKDLDLGISGFKIYKSNKENLITDSIYRKNQFFFDTDVTNFVVLPGGEMVFAVSIDSKAVGYKMYKINSALQFIDSVDVKDYNFEFNTASFANLIKGPEKEFLLNTVFYNTIDDYYYNVYYQVDNSFKPKNYFVDSVTTLIPLNTSEITVNMIYFNNEYVLMNSLKYEKTGTSVNRLKRFSRDLKLNVNSKCEFSYYLERDFHSPIIINNIWYIGNIVRDWSNNDLKFAPNFIEIKYDNTVSQKTNFDISYLNFEPTLSANNHGVFFDSVNNQIHFIYNASFSSIGYFCYDTSFQLLFHKLFEFPVNKKDTLYTDCISNGVIVYNNNIYLYGIKRESLVWKRPENPTYAFIHTAEMFVDRHSVGNEEMSTKLVLPNIFPNPSNKEISFTNIEGTYRMYIYSGTGQLLMETVNYNKGSIDISGLSEGMYIYKLINEREDIFTGKLIKQN